MTTNVERYWHQYLTSIPGGQDSSSRYVESFAFGFTAADAREIAQLVLNGTKTATGSLLWSYDADKKPLPIVGDLWVVIAGSDAPVCIITTTEVRIIPFDEVTADYAWEGGEGDRCLESWREIYWEYIDRECQRIGLQPNTKAPLVMERFRVLRGSSPGWGRPVSRRATPTLSKEKPASRFLKKYRPVRDSARGSLRY